MKEIDRDIITTIKTIIDQKFVFIKYILIFSFLGVVVSFMIKNKYTSNTIFIPDTNSSLKVPGSFGNIASLAGIDLSSFGSESSQSISPLVYPSIIKSFEFKRELLDSSFENISDSKFKNLRGFLENNISRFNIFNLLNLSDSNKLDSYKSAFYEISSDDYNYFKHIDKKLKYRIDKDDGIIELSFTSKNKHVSANVCKLAREILQNTIIELNIKSAKKLNEFSKKQYNIKKAENDSILDQIAKFKDSNKNIATAFYQNTLDRLNSDFSISSSVVKQLAAQVEQTNLKVNADTPVIEVIQPVSIPFKKSWPKRSLFVISFGFIGIAYSLFLVFLKKDFKNLFK